MVDTALERLDAALQAKDINQTAHDQMVRWLQEDEYAEFSQDLTSRIMADEWQSLLDQFYRVVSFGTGGIRGVMDLGTNRINNHTIRWATQAYASYLLKHKSDLVERGVAIAYDSRHNSQEFMRQSAGVLAANGIPVHVFDYYRSTPELSFTVRHLSLAGGIVVTASHNPPQFNGWKVYDENGVQVMNDDALLIEAEFKQVDAIKKIDYDQAMSDGKVAIIDKAVDAAFLETAKKVSTYLGRNCKIVYSPLHGVGSQSVLPALQEAGFTDIELVSEQMSLDGDFPTVKDNFPQPEFPVVYEPAITLAKKVGADLVLVSDPDADRLGMAAPDSDGRWHVLSGNQAGVVMGSFYLERLVAAGKLPQKPVIMKTTVTTDLIRDVAEKFEVEVVGDLLVGFKFIGDRLEHLDPAKSFIFGLEESMGYLFGTAYRDKGAEAPAVVAAELAAWCKDEGSTMPAYLELLYQQHGYYAERLYYKLMEGLGALDQMNLAMKQLRGQLPRSIAGREVLAYIDRLSGELRHGQTDELLETRDWDKGDMITFFFSQDERNALHVRPSGTEPKMKYYTMIKGSLEQQTKEDLESQAAAIEQAMVTIFDDIFSSIKVDVFA